MAVREIRHAPRCKWCSSPKLAEANEIFALVSKRQLGRDEALEQLAALGFENPAAGDGWKKHWGSKGHYYFVEGGEGEKEEEVRNLLTEAALELFAEALGGPDWRERGVKPTADQILEIQRTLYVHELELRLAAGLPTGLTHDQVLKSIGEGTKRKANEAQAELLRQLGTAAGAWGQAMLNVSGGEIIEGEVVDAEVRELNP